MDYVTGTGVVRHEDKEPKLAPVAFRVFERRVCEDYDVGGSNIENGIAKSGR